MRASAHSSDARRRLGALHGARWIGRAVLALVVAVTSGPALARAQTRAQVRLSLAVEHAGTACIESAELTERVAARLGYLPFGDDAQSVLRVRERRRGRALDVAVEIQRADGTIGESSVASRSGDCAALLDALALAISVAIDPTGAIAPPPLPDPVTDEAAHTDAQVTPAEPEAVTAEPSVEPLAAVASTAEAPVEATPEEAPLSLRLGIAARAAYGTSPDVTGGGLIAIELVREWWSVALELRADVPTERASERGTVRGAPYVAALVPCARVSVFMGCIGISVGAYFGEASRAPNATHRLTAFGDVFARAGADVDLGALSLRAWVDIGAPLTPTQLRIGGQTVWATEPVSAALVLALFGRLIP